MCECMVGSNPTGLYRMTYVPVLNVDANDECKHDDRCDLVKLNVDVNNEYKHNDRCELLKLNVDANDECNHYDRCNLVKFLKMINASILQR